MKTEWQRLNPHKLKTIFRYDFQNYDVHHFHFQENFYKKKLLGSYNRKYHEPNLSVVQRKQREDKIRRLYCEGT